LEGMDNELKIIVLDPGHGGSDPGAGGFGLREKDLNLDIARRLRNLLCSYMVKVYLTRDSDTDVGLGERAAFANSLGADYFLSIHVNSGGGTGFESYIYTRAGKTAETLRDVLHSHLASFYAGAGFVDRGKKRAGFSVLRHTDMPACLIENLFIDSKADSERLSDFSFRECIAGAVLNGLVSAFDLRPAGEWNPAEEIGKLKNAGLISSHHQVTEKVLWGMFAAVINRCRGRSSVSDPWDPAGEVMKLKLDGLIFSEHGFETEVPWGEFATVLNRLRGLASTNPWDPGREIERLMADGLINSSHDPASTLNWGEFATVLNRVRGA